MTPVFLICYLYLHGLLCMKETNRSIFKCSNMQSCIYIYMSVCLESAVQSCSSKVLLPPHEIKARLRVHVAPDTQLISQRWRSTEENARLCRGMNLTDRLEDCVPVRTAKTGRGSQSCDGIRLRIGVVDHDIGCVIRFDVTGKIL